jgi:predicted nucleic acid-binding protein
MSNYFVDSNVFNYALWPDQHSIKSQLASRLIVQPHFISTQVVSETLFTLQRKFNATPNSSQLVFNRLV